MLASSVAVCLIACHGGPADHFATFAERMKDIKSVEIYASGPALKKFQEKGIEVKTAFSIEGLSSEEEDALAEKIALACATAGCVITDVGHVMDVKIQKKLADLAPRVQRFAYYDNPEPYVAGGYSLVAAQVMQAAQGVLFANSHFTKEPIFYAPGKEVNLDNQKKIGIGYYPVHHAEQVAKRRVEEKAILRQALLQKHSILDQGQTILVYFGGNNEEYFSRAFPAFLSLLEQGVKRDDFSHIVIVLQQHPGAKSHNVDGKLVEKWMNACGCLKNAPKIFVSEMSTDDAQVVADGALYYQTSMAPQFVLAGIPTMQIGHETYNDILVKHGLISSVTHADQWMRSVGSFGRVEKKGSEKVILQGLGIKKSWLQNLLQVLKPGEECIESRR